MKTISIAVFCLGILAASAAAAASNARAAEKKYDGCVDRARGSDSEWTCEAAEYRRLDKILNATYRKHLTANDAEYRTLLQNSERAWVSYRDAQCELEKSQVKGGTFEPVAEYSCLRSMTSDRIKELLQN